MKVSLGCMHRLCQRTGFVQRDAEDEEIFAYILGLRSTTRVRPAMLTNPMAATNWRSVSQDRLVRQMPDPEACVSTPSPADLPWALNYLLFQRNTNVIILNGGDGTIHHTINAAIDVVAKASRQVGVSVPLPRFLFVNGGGMNMLARAFRTRGNPVSTLRTFIAKSRGATLADLPSLAVPLLSIWEDDVCVRHGFIFGSELVLNALTMYERFGRGYTGLLRFFGRLTAAYVSKNDLWRRFNHLLDPPSAPLYVDDVVHARYASTVVATVPMTLFRGLINTLPYRAEPGDGLNVIVVEPTEKGAIIATIPGLLAGREGPGTRYYRGAQCVRLEGPYTLDGELLERPVEGLDTRLTIRPSEHVVTGIWLP